MRRRFINWLTKLLGLKSTSKNVPKEKYIFIPTISEARAGTYHNSYNNSYSHTSNHYHHSNASSNVIDDIFELEIIEDGFGDNSIVEDIVVDEMIFGYSDNLVEDIIMDEIVLDSFSDNDDWL